MQQRFWSRSHDGFFQKFRRTTPVFNGGAWSVNTKALSNKILEEIRNLHREYRQNYLAGGVPECLLALAFYGRTKILPQRYNTLALPQWKVEEWRIDGAHVLHFMSDKKCWNRNNPFYAIWKENLDRADKITDISRPQPIDPIPWVNRVKIML
jgi:lipopolysaccharide biosynthesis glycosyltransferase